jgi:hypothetical protein
MPESDRNSLREFSGVHIREDCKTLTGVHDNELFHQCKFEKLNGLTLKDCVLTESEFGTDSVRDALGFTLTLGCHSFEDVRYSPLLFDLMLTLMTMTQGNTRKREQLIDVVGKSRYQALLKVLKANE